MKIARVALDVPVDTLFDYLASDASGADIGRRVIVPLRSKTAVGVLIEVVEHSTLPPQRLKPIKRVIRDGPAFSAGDLKLLKFAADYYQQPLGSLVLSALPARLRRAGTSETAPAVYALTAAGSAAAPDLLPPNAKVKRGLLALFKARQTLDIRAIRALSRSACAALHDFIDRGWVAPVEAARPAALPASSEVSAKPVLTAEQAAAVEQIRSALHTFQSFLLLGVTGSGKTEIYLRAIEAALQAGRQALLLVPEIALTPQLEAMVRARFPQTPVTSLHSGLNETERAEHWTAAQTGRARIVLGTRLSIFTPLPDLGLIIVDEEHDASYKQSEGLHYSARDLAVVRGRLANVPVVLGSATPALESYYNAISGRYRLLTLSRRIHAAPPRVTCLDTRQVRLVDGLSPQLIEAIGERLEANEQSLVFINRRGYAPVLICRACGWISGCSRCSAHLVLHLHDRRLHCHHCGLEAPIRSACPRCGNPDLAPVGQGTQRVEAALGRHFPRARILRIDRDSTRRRAAWPAMRQRIRDREVDILVGTQMLAKGHDFPNLNLVGVINADGLLYSADFRAGERLYALLTQVAGRAGRGGTQGEVLIQTEFPDHPLYGALRSQDYAAFAAGVLEERRQAGLPPFVHHALLRAEAPGLSTALAFLAEAARVGKALGFSSVTIYDPVPAAMVRLAGRERAQLLIEADSRAQLQRFLGALRARLEGARSQPARWSLDVDPLTL